MTIDDGSLEIKRKHVAQVLSQLTIDYQLAKAERRLLSESLGSEDTAFTLIEELELLTVGIRGWGCQFSAATSIENTREAIAQLRGLRVFQVPNITEFYFDESTQSERLKLYISLLDYLRLLLLEYLEAIASEESIAA